MPLHYIHRLIVIRIAPLLHSTTGIRELEEIEEIYNLFRTMSWINITLHCLRLPVPTAVYRLIVQAGQTLRWVDDKPLKTLAGIAARAR